VHGDIRSSEPAQTWGARRGVRALYAAAIVATGVLAALHGARLVAVLDGSSWPLALAGALAGMLVADLASGLVHWACDSWGSERTRWVGPGLIRAFREHHRAPQAMLEHDWIEVNGEAAAAAAVGFALLLAGWPLEPGQSPFLYALLWAAIGLSGTTNQLHRWAHDPTPPATIRRLQRLRLVLSRRQHASHHRAPHTRCYCISTGWLNPLLDGVGFWRALERAVALVFRVVPRSDPLRRHS
jgi:ubiquitin-conjugating enzyme E2 variant